MAERTFEVSATVPVAPEAALAFLADLTAHEGLHPYLVSARVVAEGDSPAGAWQEWLVHERPRLGPLRYPIRFGARLTRTSPTSVLSEVAAAPGCTIRAVTSAEPAPGGALLLERAVVRAPRLLVGYMAAQAEAAHRRTYRLLPGVLAAR